MNKPTLLELPLNENTNVESQNVLRKLIDAYRAFAKLDEVTRIIPDAKTILQTLSLKEAQTRIDLLVEEGILKKIFNGEQGQSNIYINVRLLNILKSSEADLQTFIKP